MAMNQGPEISTRRERRQRRRRERRLFFSLTSLLAIGLALGLAAGLYTAWVLIPLDETTSSPAVFRADFKRDYLFMVSQSYAADGDWEKARARLDLLQDPALDQTVLRLLEDFLREGRPAEAVRNLARMAERVGAQGTALDLFAPTPLTGGAVALIPTATPTAAGTLPPTPTLLPTPTREPTRTPPPTATDRPGSGDGATATPPPRFLLLAQERVCQADLPAPRIEVDVVDASGDPQPGVEVVVRWEGGEDRFLTGFKPGAGPGYGDFTMTPDISYAVSMADGSGGVGGLRVETCADGSGPAGWRLVYRDLGQ